MFFRLFELSCQKDDFIRKFFKEDGESWCFKWARFFNINEILDFLDLWNCVCKQNIHLEKEDSWR